MLVVVMCTAFCRTRELVKDADGILPHDWLGEAPEADLAEGKVGPGTKTRKMKRHK